MDSNHTIAVCAGRPKDLDDPLNFPITLASNFHGVNYSRCTGTPQWQALESAVAELEGGKSAHGISFSTGMAAASAILYALKPKVVVVPDVCYLGVRALLDGLVQVTHNQLELKIISIVDTKQIVSIVDNLGESDVLWLESPTNPMLQVAELEILIPAARKKGVRTVVDATFATPMSKIKPLELGATVVMHSATKMIGGHSDLTLGIAITLNREVFSKLWTAREEQGATPGSLEAFLCLRGLRTLPLRYEASSKNASLIAERMKKHEGVSEVIYPGAGNMVSFIVIGGAEGADACVAAARMIVKATSLGGVETTFERRAKYYGQRHINPGLIRMSVGIEEVEAIWSDLELGLNEAVSLVKRFKIPKTSNSCTLKSDVPPALSVDSGAVVSFETNDYNYEKMSQGAQMKRPNGPDDGIDIEFINVVTGPLAIKGAKPGDSLKITVVDISITRCWSVWEADRKCGGCLAAKRALFSEKSSVRELPIDRLHQTVQISERLRVPLEPMIGCIATASADPSQSSTFEPTYPNGGNMDLKEMKKGTVLFLPVLVDDALLYVGDLHAAMGAGEPTWVGFESAGVATLKVELIKNEQFPFPRLVVGANTIFTAVDSSSHDVAMQNALGQAYDELTNAKGLTGEEAFGFLTAKADARFGGPASKQALVVLPPVEKYLK